MNSLRYYINLIRESELAEPRTVVKQVAKLNPEKLRKFYRKSQDGGSFAYARPSLHPQQIRLISYEPTEVDQDPKLAYFQAVAPLMGANPFVPTVDEIQLVQANNLPGMQKPSYVIEGLLEYGHVPILNLYATCKPIIASFDLDTSDLDKTASVFSEKISSGELASRELIDRDAKNPNVESNNLPEINRFAHDCVTRITRACYYKPTTITKLQQVLDIIYKINDSNSAFHLDFHEYNVMFRSIGRGGYQLVITDPIAYR